MMSQYILLFLLSLISFYEVCGVELTFELYDNAKDCFYEVIDKNISSTLEYQVVTGGQYDVDVAIEDPSGEIIYERHKSQFDSFTFNPKLSGVHAVCFSNEFSTISHKVVYMDFQVGEEKPLPALSEHITVMTLMETSSQEIHRKLNIINDYQTHHRLREATSRKRAEDLNQTVLWWCFSETCLILITMIGQVLIVMNFFNDNRHSRLKGRC